MSESYHESGVKTMLWTDDPIVDAMRRDMEQENYLEQLPTCAACGNPIEDDTLWLINGECYCEDCAREMYEVYTDDYMQSQEVNGWQE